MKKILHRLLQLLQKIFNKIRKAELSEVAAFVGIYMIMGSKSITCPILFITGISCAGCGMTRAWLSLLKFDLSAAFYYHPLFWHPALTILIFLFKRKLIRKWCMAGAVLFLAVYGVRMFSVQDEVVVFRPLEGFLFRIIMKIFEVLI